MLVKEMLGRSDRPFSIADVMQRCAEKKLTLSEAAITQVSTLEALSGPHDACMGHLALACAPCKDAELHWDQTRLVHRFEHACMDIHSCQ